MADIKLKVMEASQEEAYKGVVRIDAETMHAIGVRPGDIVEIEGERKTVAIVDRAYPADIGQKLIRMDGILRRNSKTGIGEHVTVRRADAKEAKSIVIAPAQKGVMIKADPAVFKRGLLGRAVVKGDMVALGGARRRRRSFQGSQFEDIFEAFEREMSGFGFSSLRLIVAETSPKQPVIITEETQITLNPKAVEISEEKIIDVTYEDIGGLDEEIKKVREMIEIPLKYPELFDKLGISPPSGVLLHGPPGSGKTLLAKAVANESDANFILLNGPEIMDKFYGESEKKVREVFEKAEKQAPSIIFIDEIDSIAPKREETRGEVERRVVSQLLTMMDGLTSRGKVVVMGATNRPNALDPALRRPGRFDREIIIGVPTKKGRLEILKIHTRQMPLFDTELSLKGLVNKKNKSYDEETVELVKYMIRNRAQNIDFKSKKEIQTMVQKYLQENPNKNKIAKNFDIEKIKELLEKVYTNPKLVDLSEFADITHGFVGADLLALCKEAAMNVLRKITPRLKLREKEPLPQDILDKIQVTSKDFRAALRIVSPSAMREVFVETPRVGWGDVGGLDNIKQELKEAVELPLKRPEVFKRMGVRPPRGILLHGPPGTGKTLLARAVAKESEANFIQVKGPELLNKWVGESEKGVREIFKKARQTAPTIIFFDEIDALAPRRGLHSGGSHVTDDVVNTLLAEMDGLEELKEVVVIGATNRIDIIDPALLRPGRFDRLLLTSTPDKSTRKEIFEIHTKRMPLAKDVDIGKLAEKTEGYVGSDIEAVCREAAMLALRENLEADRVNKKNFEEALKKVKPSADQETMKKFKTAEEKVRSAESSLKEGKDKSYFG